MTLLAFGVLFTRRESPPPPWPLVAWHPARAAD